MRIDRNSARIRARIGPHGKTYVQEHRLRRGLTQLELSALVGCTRATISYVESGRPLRGDTAKKLMRVLDVEFDELFIFGK